MILKIFSPKNSAKNLAFLTQNKAKLCKILIIKLVFEKNANFFAENCHKSHKIVIITSNPGCDAALVSPVILVPGMLELDLSGDSRHVEQDLKPRSHAVVQRGQIAGTRSCGATSCVTANMFHPS
jgi:hypothetical protein